LARDNPDCRWVPRPEGRLDLARRVADLDRAIAEEPGPVVLVAHSAGCITVAFWASAYSGPVRAALLVAPPYLDPAWTPGPDDPPDAPHPPLPEHEQARSIVVPLSALPFPSILVASRTDPHATFEQSEGYARAWGSRLVDAGDAGHISTASGYGPWPAGELLLAELMSGPTVAGRL
jgi:predicted alpha/beta hydrolase family esterase